MGSSPLGEKVNMRRVTDRNITMLYIKIVINIQQIESIHSLKFFDIFTSPSSPLSGFASFPSLVFLVSSTFLPLCSSCLFLSSPPQPSSAFRVASVADPPQFWHSYFQKVLVKVKVVHICGGGGWEVPEAAKAPASEAREGEKE